MKQFARKEAALSLVITTPEHNQPAKTSSSLNEFFDGWLTSVSLTCQPPSSRLGLGKLPLSTTDVIRVNRATVREGREHRHWPPEVVLTFMQADVIKRKG
jgi:hypothetical protein